MTLHWHAACMEKKRNTHNILDGESERKSHLGKIYVQIQRDVWRNVWQCRMDMIGSGSIQWLAFVKTTINKRLSDFQRLSSTQLVKLILHPNCEHRVVLQHATLKIRHILYTSDIHKPLRYRQQDNFYKCIKRDTLLTREFKNVFRKNSWESRQPCELHNHIFIVNKQETFRIVMFCLRANSPPPPCVSKKALSRQAGCGIIKISVINFSR